MIVAKNRRNNSRTPGKNLFLVFATDLSEKRPDLLAKPPPFFSLRHQFGRKKASISGEGISRLVRWNGGGPLEPY